MYIEHICRNIGCGTAVCKGIPTTPYDAAGMHYLRPPAVLLPPYKQAKFGMAEKGCQTESTPLCPGLQNVV